MRSIINILSISLLLSCNRQGVNKNTYREETHSTATVPASHQGSSLSDADEELPDGEYPDGDYCADVEYYNPNTGTRHSYELNVEVEDGELTVIHWPNGGWLDESHFSPEEVDENGEVSFTSDKGYEYEISITGSGPCSFTKRNTQPMIDPEEEDEPDKDPADQDEEDKDPDQ